MDKIDCFGDICPIPVIKLQQRISSITPGETFMMVVDHSCAIEHMREVLMKEDLVWDIDEVMNGVWEVTVAKK
ncbi:MAG: sulfurtransferase TusA family protein [Youngiibacter sp.]|nr:sulfurtransferase TusA family protein [Youngiibacter sp.]